MTLQSDLADTIAKNLPAIMATELTTRLTQGEAAIAKVAEQQERISALRSDLDFVNGCVRSQDAMDALAATVATDRANVTERENALAVTLANARADAAVQALGAVMELTRAVFRNPVYVESTARTVSHMAPQGYTQSATDSETTRRTVE